jgi:hypothetical protein
MTAAVSDAAAGAPADSDRRLSAIAAGAAMAFHLFGGLMFALVARFPSSLDELPHLSFIRWMERDPALFPHYERMRILTEDGRAWTGTGTYLNHPSPYYHLMGVIDRLSGGSVLTLRLFDLALSSVGVGLMLAAGFRLLKGWRERSVFAAVLVLFPKLGVVAGIINNDNGALIAVGLAFLALVRWHERGGRREAVWLAAALALAGWTKLTVLLMLGFGVAVAELLRPSLLKRLRTEWANYLILAAGGALGAVPTLVNLHRYGRALYHSTYYFTPVADRAPMTFLHYVRMFFWQLGRKWSGLEPTPALGVVGLLLVLALAVVACVRLPRDAAGRVAVGLMISLLPTLLLHLQFGWEAVREDGFLFMAQARYYYGVWPGFALGLALLWRDWRPGLARTGLTAAVLLCLLYASPVVNLALLLSAEGKLH